MQRYRSRAKALEQIRGTPQNPKAMDAKRDKLKAQNPTVMERVLSAWRDERGLFLFVFVVVFGAQHSTQEDAD